MTHLLSDVNKLLAKKNKSIYLFRYFVKLLTLPYIKKENRFS